MTTVFNLAECDIGLDDNPRQKYCHKGIGRKIRHHDRPFISFDIETYSDEDGTTHVMLAGFSTGEVITGKSISSKEIIELIRTVALKYPSGDKDRPIFIGFVIKYEKEFLLRDLDDVVSGDIHRAKSRHVNHNGESIRYEYIDGKYFQISAKNKTKWGMRIYDTFSWFNAKLVNAAEAHLKTDAEWLALKPLVVDGKDSRNKFTYNDLDKVFKYWNAEQKVLIQLMNHIRTLIIKADIPAPKSWFGPSALATACLNKYKIKDHLDRTTLSEDFVLACRYAYYGGHIEQYKAGTYDGTVYQYDINSAYPSGMTSLWSWADSKLVYRDFVDRSLPCNRYALYHIIYDSVSPHVETMPHPFPHRTAQGKVYYPPENETWVWGAELENDWNSFDVTVIGAWVVTPGTIRPFSWIQDLYDQRLQYKRDNDPAEYIVKITLNSLYGKLAQRVGSRTDDNGNVIIPTYHELAWAGYTTAHCRGMIRETIVNSIPGSVFQIETDCVMSVTPLNVPISKKLGEWDYKISTGITTLQNGFYFLRDEDGNYTKPKTRGLVRNSVNGGIESATAYLEQLNALGKDNTPPMKSTVHGFYGQAVRAYPSDLNANGERLTYGQTKTNENYMKWTDSTRETEFVGNGKRVWAGQGNPAATLVVLENGWNSLINPDRRSSSHTLPWANNYITGDEVQEYNLFQDLSEFVIFDEI